MDKYELIIEAGRTERHYWKDLWRYRELFYFLAWRDILVRYKQTIIGITSAIIRPVLTMVGGDFYGTGNVNLSKWGPILVKGTWSMMGGGPQKDI